MEVEDAMDAQSVDENISEAEDDTDLENVKKHIPVTESGVSNTGNNGDNCEEMMVTTPASCTQSTPGKGSEQSTPSKGSEQSTPSKGSEQSLPGRGSTQTSPNQASDISMETRSESGPMSSGPTPAKDDTISISSSAPTTPLSVVDKPKKRQYRKRGNDDAEGVGEGNDDDDDDLLSGDDEITESADEPIDKALEDRLLQDPIDCEVMATDLDLSKVKDGEVQQRSGRAIKKPKPFSPDNDDYSPKKKKFSGRGRKKQKPSLSGAVVPFEKRSKLKEVDPKWIIPFKHGWRREIVLRNTYSEGKSRPADVYYYTPNGAKLRSGPQIATYLEDTKSVVTMDSFTWIKETIYEEPHETVRYAGRNVGRPGSIESSKSPKISKPLKTPKSPMMKKSPFVKSPLSLKKAAIATALPSSPKTTPTVLKFGSRVILKQSSTGAISTSGNPVLANSLASSVTVSGVAKETVLKTIMSDGGKLSFKIVTPATTTAVSSKLPVFRDITSMVHDVKKPVAKKHTGAKRPRTPVDDFSDSLSNIAKKYRPDKLTPSNVPTPNQRLCGMDCPGRLGVPPSLHCTVCMCMFHPECVGKAGHQRIDGFVCRACKAMNKKFGPPSGSVIAPMRSIPLHTPPAMQITPSSNSCLKTGPPPLMAAPTMGLGGVMRGPPPLRMAPITGSVVVNHTPPPLTSIIRPQSDPTVVDTIQSMNLLPSINFPNNNNMPNAIMSVPSPAPAIISSAPSPMLPGSISSSMLQATATAPISINMPLSVPKDVNGQILALPNNVTNKLNLTKPISLKVNGQRFVIPPNCFINTNEGAKVYLPQGYLPGNMIQGASSPLNVNLMKNVETDGQVINVSPYGDNISNSSSHDPAGEDKDKRSSRTLPRRSQRKLKPECFIQVFHVGFDSMLHIFQYLDLKDLLRANRVCKTWKRVSSQHCLWKKVQLRGCRVSDWNKAAMMMRDMHTQTLDLRGLQHIDETSKTWQQLTEVLRYLVHLRHMDFGQCPGSMLHSVTDKIKHLEGLTAEFITDTVQEPQMWTTNVKLDVGKFCTIKQLEILKLRGVCGLLLPEYSFSGELSELAELTGLKTLSLTTLRAVPENDFSFLSSLINLEELELGDISDWKPETYNQLSMLPQLRSLRLECGVDYKEGGLGPALLSLHNLKNLELIKFAVSGGLVNNLHKVKSLRSLSIWPDTEKQAARVNTCTLRAVSEMTSLAQLDWGIMIDQSSPTNLDDSSPDSNDSMTEATERSKQKDGIPLLPENTDLNQVDDNHDETESSLDIISVNQLVDRLFDYLPDTKIRVFKVPIISASNS